MSLALSQMKGMSSLRGIPGMRMQDDSAHKTILGIVSFGQNSNDDYQRENSLEVVWREICLHYSCNPMTV